MNIAVNPPMSPVPDMPPGRALGKILRSTGADLVYKTQRNDHWWVDMGESVYPVRAFEYSKRIWRICSSFGGWAFVNVRKDITNRIAIGPRKMSGFIFEMSCLPSEVEVVVPFVLRHLTEPVAEDPEWLDPRHGSLVGEPFRGYHWTKAAYVSPPR